MLDSWSVYLTLYRMDGMSDSWSVYLTIIKKGIHVGTCDLCICHYTKMKNMLDSWSVHLTLYRMMPCWDSWSVYLNIFTEWRHVGLVICVSDIIQDDAMFGLVICIWHLYMMTQCWDLVTYVSDIIQNDVGLVICISDIYRMTTTLDSWSVYLTLYRMMLDLWSVYLTLIQNGSMLDLVICIWHYIEWRPCLDSWYVYLTLYRMDKHVGLVICVSDILQNDAHVGTHDLCIWHYYRMVFMLGLVICIWHYIEWTPCWDLWSVYLTFTEWCYVGTRDMYLTFTEWLPCWDSWICVSGHYTERIHVGDSWSVYLTLYRMTPCLGLVICVSAIIQKWKTCWDSWSSSFCIMSDTQITSPTWRSFCIMLDKTDH